jgi:hypothetical protein
MLKNHPEDPIIVSKCSEIMSNILKPQKPSELIPIEPYLEELHTDMMKIHDVYPTNPYVEELLHAIKDKLDDIRDEKIKEATGIMPAFEEEDAAEERPIITPISLSPEEDLRDLGFLNDNLDKLKDVLDNKPLEPMEEENLRAILENIQNTKAIDPEGAESTSQNLGIPKTLADIATMPNIPPELAVLALETFSMMSENPETMAMISQDPEIQEKLMDAFVLLSNKSSEPEFDERKPVLDAVATTLANLSKDPEALDMIRQNPEFIEAIKEQMKKDPEDDKLMEAVLCMMEELTKDDEEVMELFCEPDTPSALEDLYKKECDILPILR